jgi:hypothetical protein
VTDYRTVQTSALSNLTEVRLYEETVTKVAEAHLEVPILLPCIFTAVLDTIANPTHIEPSYGGSVVFVNSETCNASGDAMRVPVMPIAGTTSGRVRTVVFATPNQPPQIIWKRTP